MQYWDSFLHKWCVLKRSGIPPAFSQFKENCWQFPVYENKCDCCKLDSDCSAPIVIGQFTLFCQKGVTVLEHGACPGKMWGPVRTWRHYFTLTSTSGRSREHGDVRGLATGSVQQQQCWHHPGPALTPDYFPRLPPHSNTPRCGLLKWPRSNPPTTAYLVCEPQRYSSCTHADNYDR